LGQHRASASSADRYGEQIGDRTLAQASPAASRRYPTVDADIKDIRRDRLSGLLHEYSQVE
jgi:hypothetical protein